MEYGYIDKPADLARVQANYKKYVDAVVNAVIATKQGSSIPVIPGEGTSYIVKSGDSLWSIANRYNTTVSAIKNMNNLTSDSLSVGQVLQIPSGTSSNTGTTYTVTSGDSLWSIANRYNTTVDAIKSANNLTSNTLSIGQVLRIPSGTSSNTGTTYTVASGDSLWSIANRYNTTVDAIKSANNLTSNTLSIGQVLRIPSGTSSNTGTTYTVVSGDSLWSIANRYNTTVDAIKQASGIVSNNLSIGQVLTIPK